MRKKSLEEKLARLGELAGSGDRGDAVEEIRQALSSKNNTLVAKAAKIAAQLELRELTPEIIAAFTRFLDNPVRSDPFCRAKLAAVEALNVLDCQEGEVFLKGIRHIQMEPSFGPPIDTADHLRAACAAGLYRLGHPDLLCELVSLLVDREPVARRAAIKILTETGQDACELLLRLKVLQGDKEAVVLGDCFNGLMAVNSSRSLPFVEQFLSSDNLETAEEAALALGNSRLSEAFVRLAEFREGSVTPVYKHMLLLPIALTRLDEAFALLLDVVRNERTEYAVAAVDALSIFRDSPERNEQIEKAVIERDDHAVTIAYEKEFQR